METLHEEVRERLLAETEDFRDALEKKDKESSLLITELQGFNSKLLELQKKITEDTENFELKLSSSESQISELSAKVIENIILIYIVIYDNFRTPSLKQN